ncbi:MAG: glycosyl hydrolase family 28 protein, partial [Oscillospiraceae bacterium]|nr:glycosyl hydrolase family 28 protein [Oscillospiraceae bacterium]
MKLVFLTARSASLELDNTDIYYSSQAFDVSVNGEILIRDERRNVFSLYDLLPDTGYTVCAGTECLTFQTEPETVTLDVRAFQAVGDGVTDDTAAIQAAILSCPPQGRVWIPAGTYWVKPLFLKSDISIELDAGATLLGETDRRKYPVLPGRIPRTDQAEAEYYLGTWEGQAESAFAGLITGIAVENVKLYGRGVIDGNAQQSDWWKNDIVKRIAWRPRGVFLNRCRNIGIQGITSQNTASWNQH